MSSNMAAANRIADNQSDNDPGQEVGQCPLQQEKLQLVPVRYATVEPGQAVTAAGFSPPLTGEYRPDGIRPIRHGWLYVIHSVEPQTLRSYAVRPDGSVEETLWNGIDALRSDSPDKTGETAILVKRQGSLKVLYSQVELEAKRAALLLAKPSVQAEVMLEVAIGGYCPGNGTPHLLPPDELGKHLADDHGERQTSEQRLDYGRYQWTESAEWQAASANHIKGQVRSEYQQDSACLIVSDVVAQAKDLLGAWTEIARQETEWLDEEPEKHFAARAIDGFMQLDLGPMADRAGSGDIPGWLGGADDNDLQQLRQLMDLQTQHNAQHREDLLNNNGLPFKSTQQRALADEIAQVSGNLAERLGTDAEAVRKFASETHDDYFERVFGSQQGNSWLAQEGIEDIIRLDEMREFLVQADRWQAGWREHKEQVGRDLKALMPRWHEYASLLDGEDDQQAIFRSSLEHRLFATLAACGQQDFLTEHYVGEVTSAHRLHVTPSWDFVSSAAANWKNALAALTGLMVAQATPGTFTQWRERLAGQSHLRLQGLDALSEEAHAVVVAELTTKEALMGRALLAELLDDFDELSLEQRFAALFEQTSPGLRHQLYTRFAAYQLGWEIPDRTILDRIQQTLNRAERLAVELAPLAEREKALERRRKQIAKRNYDIAIREVRRARNLKRRELAAVLDELVAATYPHNSDSTHVIRVSGLSEAPSRAALNERRAYRQSLEEVGNWQALIRNEQGDIAPSRAIPVGVSGLMLVLNGVMLGFAIQQLATAMRTRERLWEEIFNTLASMTYTAAAVASVREIIHDTRYRRLYQGQSFQAAVRQASGSIDHLESWARLTNRAMIGVAGFSAMGAALDFFRQLYKLDRAHNDAQRIAGSIALVGDVSVTVGTAPIAIRGLFGMVRGEAAITLRLTLLRWAVPLNWFVAAGVALVIVGELLYEYYSLSPLQQWCRHSAWGDEPQGWDLPAHHRQLAALHGDPVLLRRVDQPRRQMAMPVGPNRPANSLYLRLHLPGIATPAPHNLAIGLWAMQAGASDSRVDLFDDLVAHGAITQEGASSRLDYVLDPKRIERYNAVFLVIRLIPDGAAVPITTAFQMFSRYDTQTFKATWDTVAPLDGQKGRGWRSLPLTPWPS